MSALLYPFQSRDEARFLQDFKLSEWDHFIKRGFPTRKEEKWKYTDLSKLAQAINTANLKPSYKSNTEKTESIKKHLTSSLSSIQLVFVDGYFCAELSNLNELPAEVTAGSLFDITDKESSFLTESFDSNKHPFACLNGSLSTDGFYISIPKNITIKSPIHCVFLQTQKNVISSPRNKLLVGENSQVTLIEEYQGHCTDYMTNALTKIIAQPNASVNYYKIQTENVTSRHFATLFLELEEASTINCFNLTVGGLYAREEVFVKEHKQASCCLNGLYALKNEGQQSDHYLYVDHHGNHSQSSMIYKGVLAKKTKAVFNGKVYVAQQAKQIQAHQENHTLLLSSDSEMNTKPELEIYSENVKCTHGATVGQIDSEALFYLQARGIEKESAHAMLRDAFVSDFFSAINHELIQEKMRKVCNYAD